MNLALPKHAGEVMLNDKQLDTIVRFHDIRRLSELERCVFSLVGQNFKSLRIILALQRFSAQEIAKVRATLAPILEFEKSPQLSIVNWEDAEPADARSALLNLGLCAAQGRYIAFLDYDDVLYPEAYEVLVPRLEESGAAIAFATVRVVELNVYHRFFYAARKIIPSYSGSNLLDLFRNNFCPVHSYVIDRMRVPKDILSFDTSLAMEEDYDLLLRICAVLQSDFSLVRTEIGDYFYKTDCSNTVPTFGNLANSRLHLSRPSSPQ